MPSHIPSELIPIITALISVLGAILVAWITTQRKFQIEVELSKEKIKQLEERLKQIAKSMEEEIESTNKEVGQLNAKIAKYEDQIEQAVTLFKTVASTAASNFGVVLPHLPQLFHRPTQETDCELEARENLPAKRRFRIWPKREREKGPG